MNLKGLSSAQVQTLRKKYGRNTLAQVKPPGAVRIFFSQFKDAMVLILLVATGISALLGEWTDAVTIIVIVILNAVLGFIQEYRTEKTLEALRSMTAPTAKGNIPFAPATDEGLSSTSDDSLAKLFSAAPSGR